MNWSWIFLSIFTYAWDWYLKLKVDWSKMSTITVRTSFGALALFLLLRNARIGYKNYAIFSNLFSERNVSFLCAGTDCAWGKRQNWWCPLFFIRPYVNQPQIERIYYKNLSIDDQITLLTNDTYSIMHTFSFTYFLLCAGLCWYFHDDGARRFNEESRPIKCIQKSNHKKNKRKQYKMERNPFADTWRWKSWRWVKRRKRKVSKMTWHIWTAVHYILSESTQPISVSQH